MSGLDASFGLILENKPETTTLLLLTLKWNVAFPLQLINFHLMRENFFIFQIQMQNQYFTSFLKVVSNILSRSVFLFYFNLTLRQTIWSRLSQQDLNGWLKQYLLLLFLDKTRRGQQRLNDVISLEPIRTEVPLNTSQHGFADSGDALDILTNRMFNMFIVDVFVS